MLEPTTGADNVNLAVQINVGRRQAFIFVIGSGENRRPGPFTSGFGITWNLKQKQLPGSLIPRGQLRPAVAIEVSEDLVMMLIGAAVLDQAPRPWRVRIVIWMGIFPPPDLIAARIPSEDYIEVPVLVDVGVVITSFDTEGLIVECVF